MTDDKDDKYAEIINEARRFFYNYYVASKGGIVDKETVKRNYEECIRSGDELLIEKYREKDYYIDAKIKDLEVDMTENNDIIVKLTGDYTVFSYSPRRDLFGTGGYISKYYFLFNENGELIEHQQQQY